MHLFQDSGFKTSGFVDLHTQSTAYARLAESETFKTGSLCSITEKENITDESTLFPILPISAESTGILPDRKGNNLLSISYFLYPSLTSGVLI